MCIHHTALICPGPFPISVIKNDHSSCSTFNYRISSWNWVASRQKYVYRYRFRYLYVWYYLCTTCDERWDNNHNNQQQSQHETWNMNDGPMQQHNICMLACWFVRHWIYQNRAVVCKRISEHYIQQKHAILPFFEALFHPGVDVSWLLHQERGIILDSFTS